MDIDFEKSLKTMLIPMRIALTHPELPTNLKWLVQFFLSFGPFSLQAVVIFYNLYLNAINHDFTEACNSGILTLTYVGVSFSDYIMFSNRKSIKHLMDEMVNEYKTAAQLPQEEQNIFLEYAKKKTIVCKGWMILLLLNGSLFIIKSTVLMIYYYCTGEPRFVQIYDLVYPDCIERRKGELSMFLFSYFSMLAYGIYAGFVNLSFLPLGPVLMIHVCGHLEISKNRIMTVFSGDINEANEKLNDIVRRLQYTYKFVQTVKGCFIMYFELTLKFSALALPVTFYTLLESLQHGEFSLEFSSYIISGIALSSVPCYYSDMLLEKGEEVSLALYASGWERTHNSRVRSTILLLLVRFSRPITIKAMFTTLCLEALTDMFQQAYTIFSLMNAMLN